MGKFGWDLPPGVTMSMIDPPSSPCEVCGLDPEGAEGKGGCICPACPVCESVGDARCYERHGIERTAEQIKSKAETDAALEAEARAEEAFWNQFAEDQTDGK